MKLRITGTCYLAFVLLCGLCLVSPICADTIARTDLASIAVTALPHQMSGATTWQTVYDYAGGQPPPDTQIMSQGKWADPPVRTGSDGVTYSFPAVPDQPQAGQTILTRFVVDRPLPNVPTRATVKFTLGYNEGLYTSGKQRWSALRVDSGDAGFQHLFSVEGGGLLVPLKNPGANTLAFTFGGAPAPAITLNGVDVTAELVRKPIEALQSAGAMVLPGLSLTQGMIQFPGDKGDWYTINAVKIEQQRPPLETSAAAAVDLNVPGASPVRITIEVVNAKNVSQGFVVKDATVAPGQYRLYWDGLDQPVHAAQGSAPIAAGSYGFRLTTSHVHVSELGDINNSTPPWNVTSYGMVSCTALTMTPPGTPAPNQELFTSFDSNPRQDERRLSTADSVQLDCVGYDACYGQWVGADGTVIHTKTGNAHMQYGRSIGCMPADSSAPYDPQKQFYFGSASFPNNGAVVTCSFPGLRRDTKTEQKLFTSPDWNRQPGKLHYTVAIGKVDQLVGPQKYLFFEVDPTPGNAVSDWTFSNVSVHEDGTTGAKAIVFNQSLFTPRPKLDRPAIPIGPTSVIVENGGLSVHLKNSASVNYPLEYTVTPNTVMDFDFEVVSRGHSGRTSHGNGIGLDTEPIAINGKGDQKFIDLLNDNPRWGVHDQDLGAIPYPDYTPNTLTTDAYVPPPDGDHARFLFQRGYYGLKISDDGKLLFACNNADNRLEVRNIAGDGSAIAKISIDYPMFVCLAPAGVAGAPVGARYVFVDSPTQGIVRIAWDTADNTFGPPQPLTPASEFAYPRGIVYDAAVGKLFVCDSFNDNRSKCANQIAVIDPATGRVLSRFGTSGGVDPGKGGTLTSSSFTCPLTIDADSKGALWVNDYYTGEVRKYAYDASTGGLELLRRVEGSNSTNTSHFYWMPGGPPDQVWTIGDFMVRHEADVAADGHLTNQRATDAHYQLSPETLRPYAHFARVAGHLYANFCATSGVDGREDVYEIVGDNWVKRFAFGRNSGDEARAEHLLAGPGEPPTDLDKAIKAAGDADWESRPWAWSDLNSDGKVEYSAANPEFKIGFNSPINIGYNIPPSGSIRDSDGAYLFPVSSAFHKQSDSIAAIVPRIDGIKVSYDWADAKVSQAVPGEPVMDVIGQDSRIYVNRVSTQRHDVGSDVIDDVEAYDPQGHLLWTRANSDFSPISIEPVGPGLISDMERSWSHDGPVSLRTSDGDLVCRVFCKVDADCWSQGVLRVDDDTALVGIVQVYKVTGLSTVHEATAEETMAAAH